MIKPPQTSAPDTLRVNASNRWGTLCLTIALNAAFVLSGWLILANTNASADEPVLDWVTVDPGAQENAACSLECQLCSGYYAPSPKRDLELSTTIEGAVKASADEYQYDADGNAKLSGDVVLQQDQLQLEADQVYLEHAEQQVTAKGSVRLRDNLFVLDGDSATIQLVNKDAQIENAHYLSHSSGAQGKAKSLRSSPSEQTVTVEQGYYTNCPRNQEDWSIRGKTITLNQATGWGSASHMRLHFKKVPLFYAPYLRFPIDDRRQSGLLIPNIDFQEPDIAQPIYWNIAENYDATITPRHIGNRGDMLEAEFRYLTHYGAGEFNGGYLDDDSSFNKLDRKLFSWQHDTFWQDKWTFNTDTTYLSDNSYFDDLGTSLSVNSESHLLREASIGYQDQLGANKQFDSQLTLLVQAFQTIDEGIAPNDRPYRKLPELEWNLAWKMPAQFRWQQRLQLTRFEQLFDPTYQESDRSRYTGTLSYRQSNNWAFVAPAVQINQVNYQHQQSSLANPDNQSITVPTAWIDGGVFFERPLIVAEQRFLQTLEPRLFLLWTPSRSQNDNPNFDTTEATFDFNQLFRSNRFIGGDRFGDNRQLTLALTSRVIDTETGSDRLSVSVGQALYFEDRSVQLSGNTPDTEETSPLAAQVQWYPNSRLRLRLDSQWDSDTNTLIGTSTDVTLFAADKWDKTGHIINVRHNYVSSYNGNNRLEQADVSAANKINQQWSIYNRWLFDLQNRKTLEHFTGLGYESCCWRASLLYHRRVTDAELITTEKNDYSVLLQIELKGLANLGGTLENLLQDGIDNYTQRFNRPFTNH